MPSIQVSRKQKNILDIIEKEYSVSKSFISSNTKINLKELGRILQNLLSKGLITQHTISGELIYSPTGIEYTLSLETEEEERVLQFIRNTGGGTRNLIAVKFGFNWRKTIKVLKSLEEKGLLKEFRYRKIRIYSTKD